MKKALLIGLISWGLLPNVLAQVRLAEFWQSGMVIQRDKPITVWGSGRPGSTVSIQFDNEEKQATVAIDSVWIIHLSARPASTVPHRLLVRSDSAQLELTNLLIGDVWVCAGQSNMAFPMTGDQHFKQTLSEAYNPLIRLFDRMPGAFRYNEPFKSYEAAYLTPNTFFKPGQWQIADSASIQHFSAVCYYAGKQLQQSVGIPIGLIHMAVGGSPTEAWMQPEITTTDTLLQSIFGHNWLQNPALEPWCIQRGHENLDSLVHAGYPVPTGRLGINHPYQPGFLFNAAFNAMARLAIKGVMWYQGESNALSLRRVLQHEHLFPLLVHQWRRTLNSPDLPFFFCQLSSISTDKGYQSHYWPLFRDGQRRLAAQLPHVGMAVTSDVGHRTNVHPTDKKTVGERLARTILIQTYRQPLLAAPEPIRLLRRKQGWTLQLAHSGTGLKTADGLAVRGFAIGDASGPNKTLDANLSGRRIKLTGTQAGQYLYYSWQPYSTANVVNSEGLPLTTFRLALP